MDLFLLRLLLSFLIGGTWVTIITEATLRFGPRAGGLLAGFPSTVAFSLAFIGWEQSTAAAVQATTALPLALGFTATFPIVFAYLARNRGFATALAGALGYWGAASFILSAISVTVGVNFFAALAGFYGITALFYLVLGSRTKARVLSPGVRVSGIQWLWRFVLAGGIVVGAIVLSATLGPIEGGVFASFPAIITSTIYIVNRVEGLEASRAIARPMMIATVFTIVPYTVVVRLAFPTLGILYGSLVGYAVAAPLSVLAYLVSRRIDPRGGAGILPPSDPERVGPQL
jgi:hypothetical protein